MSHKMSYMYNTASYVLVPLVPSINIALLAILLIFAESPHFEDILN